MDDFLQPMAATCIPRLRPQPPQQDRAVPRHNGRGRMGGGGCRCHVAESDVATKRQTMMMSSFVVVLYVFMLDNGLTPSALANQCLHRMICREVFTFPGLFRMESMWNPWNPSGIPYGIHGMNVG